ncbi:lysophospholipid acyltransferase family protein [Actinocorallia sp. B10E7]|uniref:lysophospholipid acyltransferase family protein n=1 Tax=Actinocorallia sp. B10E7 TaxID=3153558 RepID=UPI00325F24D2
MSAPTTWTPPHPALFKALDVALAPIRALNAPVFHGIENVPRQGPALLVGNHTVMPLLDVPVMMAEIRARRGVWIRSIADHVHWRVPLWRDILRVGGCVDGTRENCRRMLADGETVLVFPGGAYEVTKFHGQKYQLAWQERLGFVRMAIEAGCPIIPFGAVGVEDQFPILVDSAHPLQAPVRMLSHRILRRRDLVFPVLGLDPRPERLYFSFGEPIDTTQWAGLEDDVIALTQARDLVRKTVAGLVDDLLAEQSADPGRRPWGRLFSKQ